MTDYRNGLVNHVFVQVKCGLMGYFMLHMAWSGTTQTHTHTKARYVDPPCIKPVAWYFHYHAMTHKG